MSEVVTLAKELIACPSITPNDAGCQDILLQRLQKLGFNIQLLPYGPVKNFWARLGTDGPLLVFAGHTDVVPTGPLEKWQSDPFIPTIRNGLLFGRGAADMKSSIAAMVIAVEDFIATKPDFSGSIGFIITSDEEGDATDGTIKVVEYLQQQKTQVDYCIVGEASSEQRLGDTVKIGRRGSLSAKLIVQGLQGHIAYPAKSDNAIHKIIPLINELISIRWDKGNEFFSPTSFQISNIHAGTGANNVIPGQCEILFNFRYSPLVTADGLKNKINALLNKHDVAHEIYWTHGAEPFLSKNKKLANIVKEVIEEKCAVTPIFSTTGGTSDARFIIKLGCEILELGPINDSIHKIDEHISVTELELLKQCYQEILEKLL